jgi:serine/threonine protein phosphatase PrpC
MGTTLCGVMITSVGRLVVNIGDSRTYAWTADRTLPAADHGSFFSK